MLYFTGVKYRNFLSTGSKYTEIDLSATSTTLVVGNNGSGKCLRGNTEVEIKFGNKRTEDKFKSFLEAKQIVDEGR